MSDAFDPNDPTAASGMDLGPMPDIGLDTELSNDSQPFLGVVVIDQFEPNFNKDGWQWHLGVRPIDFAVRGETGCFHAKANIPKAVTPASKMGKMLYALQEIKGKEKIKLGKGELLGFTAVFVRRAISGKMGDGSEWQSTLLISVRAATEEETARAAGAAQVSIDNAAIQSGTPPATSDLSQEDIDAIITVIDGKTAQEFQLAVLSSPLNANLMSLVLSGKALEILKDKGLIAVDKKGVVTAAVAV